MEDILKKLPDLENGIDNDFNINISYRIKKKSNKPYLVFLHGYNGSSKSWVFQFEYFSKYYSVLAIDFPGFGTSPMKLEQEPEKKSELPKIHKSQKSKLPTQEQRKAQQGTLKGLTQFEYDLKKVKPLYDAFRKDAMNKLNIGKKIAKGAKRKAIDIKKYFTQR